MDMGEILPCTNRYTLLRNNCNNLSGAISLFRLRWRQGKMKPLNETITRLPYLKPRCYNSYITLCTVKSYSIHTLPMIPQTAVTPIRHQEFQYLDHFRTAYRANYMFGRIHL